MKSAYLVEFTATMLQMEDGVVKSSVKTTVIGGQYDLDKDKVIRNALDQLKAIHTPKIVNPVKQEANNGKGKTKND